MKVAWGKHNNQSKAETDGISLLQLKDMLESVRTGMKGKKQWNSTTPHNNQHRWFFYMRVMHLPYNELQKKNVLGCCEYVRRSNFIWFEWLIAEQVVIYDTCKHIVFLWMNAIEIKIKNNLERRNYEKVVVST